MWIHRNVTRYKIVHLTVPQEYKNLWQIVQRSLTYIEKTFGRNFDWIFRVDDDAYVIMENLRKYLQNKKVEELVYHGQTLRGPLGGFKTGGPGYILSRKVLKLFISSLEHPECGANNVTSAEDAQLAICLRLVSQLFYLTRFIVLVY